MNKKMCIFGNKIGLFRNVQGVIYLWLFAITNIILVFFNKSLFIVSILFIILSLYPVYVLCFSEFYFVVDDTNIYTTNLFNKKFKTHYWNNLKNIEIKKLNNSSDRTYPILECLILDFADNRNENNSFKDLKDDENIILIVNTPKINETLYNIVNSIGLNY